jgi:Flp pilus assembly protein TadD
MLKFSAHATIGVVVYLALSAQTTTDSSQNHRPPELYKSVPTEQSDYEIALRLIRHKQYAEAIPHLQFALADKPKDTEILNYLGYAKRMVGDYDSSQYYYERALTIDPNNKETLESLGELYLAKNDLLAAQKELESLTTLCPSDCSERDALAKAIAGYKPPASPVAATTSASGSQR